MKDENGLNYNRGGFVFVIQYSLGNICNNKYRMTTGASFTIMV